MLNVRMRSIRAGATGLVALLCATASQAAWAQTMNFSVYNDAYVDNGTVYLYSSVSDFSSGCSHASYSTTSTIYSPSNRTSASTSSGIYSSTSISFDAEYGNYTVVTTGNYFCNCSHMTGYFGGGTTLPVPAPPSPPRVTKFSETGTYEQTISGVLNLLKYAYYQVDKQDGSVWPYGGTITEVWSGWQNACNIAIGNTSGSMALDSNKRFNDLYHVPKAAVCSGGCYVLGIQDYKLSSYQGGNTSVLSHPVTYSCASIDVF